MSLIIATGSNLGDKGHNLLLAKKKLLQRFELVAASNVYHSPPVGYVDQPSFYNQVLEFRLPQSSPQQVMDELLEIELQMGRKRDMKWGPRLIDLDIIFWGVEEISSPNLTIPHPLWSERAFVALPLRELPFFKVLSKSFKIPQEFDSTAEVVSQKDEL